MNIEQEASDQMARWGARVLDLDIALWEGGAWASRGLTVPHVAFRERAFVLTPATALAPPLARPADRLDAAPVTDTLDQASSPP